MNSFRRFVIKSQQPNLSSVVQRPCHLAVTWRTADVFSLKPGGRCIKLVHGWNLKHNAAAAICGLIEDVRVKLINNDHYTCVTVSIQCALTAWLTSSSSFVLFLGWVFFFFSFRVGPLIKSFSVLLFFYGAARLADRTDSYHLTLCTVGISCIQTVLPRCLSTYSSSGPCCRNGPLKVSLRSWYPVVPSWTQDRDTESPYHQSQTLLLSHNHMLQS